MTDNKHKDILKEIEWATCSEDVLNAISEYEGDQKNPESQAIVTAAGHRLHELMKK